MKGSPSGMLPAPSSVVASPPFSTIGRMSRCNRLRKRLLFMRIWQQHAFARDNEIVRPASLLPPITQNRSIRIRIQACISRYEINDYYVNKLCPFSTIISLLFP